MIILYILIPIAAIYLAIRLYQLRVQKRKNIEDALKFLYTSALGNSLVSLEALAGRLGLSKRATVRLIQQMTNRGLVTMSEGHVLLTLDGKALGLQILRAHRLWERYLSDYTDVPIRDIHRLAEDQEHKLNEEEISKLEAQLGYPRRDPHGDLIPDKEGKLSGETGVPVTDWPANKPARVVHVEDEPESIFLQVIDQGILPGTILLVREVTQSGVRLELEGQDIWLAPIVASNVYVMPAALEEEFRGKTTLADLKPHQKARVAGISKDIRGLLRRRLFDLGFTRGALVEASLRSSFGKGDPTAYKIRGTTIALRREETVKIYVDMIEGQA